jgi:hypothetical protein
MKGKLIKELKLFGAILRALVMIKFTCSGSLEYRRKNNTHVQQDVPFQRAFDECLGAQQ